MVRLQMLQVARLAPQALGADSTGLVRNFVRSQQNKDGGFRDRAGASDLYYTVFGLDALIALESASQTDSVPDAGALRAFLRTRGDGAGLDFVHVCCLARAWAGCLHLTGDRARPDAERSARIWERIRQYRCPDGGFNPAPGALHGTAYGSFMALAASQDLQQPLPHPETLLRSLMSLLASDGAWSNERGMTVGATNATAAAVAVCQSLDARTPPEVGDWLMRQCHAQGGFRAGPQTPMPDLLSTATSLHALSLLQVPCQSIRDRCLDYVDSLWTNRGGFHGHWADDDLDVEYTYYGLLALGHLTG